MMRRILATPALVGITIIASAWATQPALGRAVSARTDTVHVAPPTGVPDTDRASILAALARVSARGTVQFAPGTYVVGKLIAVTTPGVTLLGDPTGTILRGCEPADLSSRRPGAPPATPNELVDCNVLGLAGDRQSVRQFTFESAWHGLILGCCWSERMAGRTAGGHRIEGNVFRNSSNGIRLIGDGAEPAVIRNNRFVNLFHAVVVNGMTAQILDNDISVPEPGRVPLLGHPSFALTIFEGAPPPDWRDETRDLHCTNNIIAGNRITGHPDAIVLTLVRPGGSCRHNTIRDNTIEVRRVGFTPPSDVVAVRTKGDSTIVGVPLLLANLVIDSGPRGVVEDNVVEGNRIVGAEGVGIEIYRATRNRIVDNNITGIRRRDPFPGNTLGSLPEWHEGNGSGIWVSRGSNENQIAGNTFEEIAAHAVVLESDSNRVEMRRAGDSVRDLGIANRVSQPETPAADTEVATSISFAGAVGEARPVHIAAIGAQDTTPTRMVDVDGRAMRVRLSVPERREPGAPFVILEAGGFGGVDSWETVFSRIAAFAPVIAYDRRGLGLSEPDGERPTPDHAAGVLRKLLQNVGATPPYVLVGHSWGGTLIRVLADRHLDEVTGMVLLDPTDCESSAQDLLAVVRAAGGNEEQFRGLGGLLRAANALLPPGRREMAEQAERCTVGEAGDLVSSRRVPKVPIAVLIGAAPARTAPEFPLPPSINGVALSAGLHDLRLKHLTALTLASADGLLLVSSAAGHYVQRDDPELTLHAIRHVLTRARRPPR